MQYLETTFSPLLSPERTMDIVLEAIRELVDYELGVVLSFENDTNLVVRRAKGALVNSKLKDYKLSLEKHFQLSEIIQKGEVFLFDDDEDEEHLDTFDGVIEMPSGHSCLVAPLHVEGNNLGLLTLDHRQCDMFTPQIVKITSTLSRLISLALAQSVAADTLKKERDALVVERNDLMKEYPQLFKGLIGSSKAWKEILDKIKIVAPSDLPVMVTGETGTGKEKAARAIHSLSSRAERPFIALNCSALSSNLAESELFGHEKGSFTGAVNQRKGRFELADTGTLFLDEIGDLPLDIQPKLLRALQEGTFERLGSEKSMTSDVRIICATHVDLEKAVAEGRFREDLYYRLNVFPVELPPLRERENDVILIANHFLQNVSDKTGKSFSFTNDALAFLKSAKWPGNVRELQNTIERATILSANGEIDISHLNFKSMKTFKKKVKPENETQASLDDVIVNHIKKILEQCDGKIYGSDGAAALLGMKPTTLQSKIKKFGIVYK
ncbi:MAG: sigma 54-interacting transcriptional regulator [Rhodothermaceae bacterium]